MLQVFMLFIVIPLLCNDYDAVILVNCCDLSGNCEYRKSNHAHYSVNNVTIMLQ